MALMTLLRTLALYSALLTTAAFTTQATQASSPFGTLLKCESSRCLWADSDGREVSSQEMMRQLMAAEGLDFEADTVHRRRLEQHVQYIEEVQIHARDHGVAFGYSVGVNARHLYLDDTRVQTPIEFVKQEFHASRRRRLEEQEETTTTTRKLDTLPATLNWCSTDNPLKRNVCTPVKSQNKCGSCWAFAASDSIEMAVSVTTNTNPLALSPQQLLDCSRSNQTRKFTYCWAKTKVSGAAWLNETMSWKSENNGCDGGMTHVAFMDVGQKGIGLLSELVMPYTESMTDLSLVPGHVSSTTQAPKSLAERELSCVKGSANTSAMVEGYKQAIGFDGNCASTTDSTQLLKEALQKQPISVAINSGSNFKDYKTGVYECPNNGDFPPPANSASINHAIVLVGYGNEDGKDYWILKNSYGFGWGEKGFLRLRMDSKLNCGLSVFAVVPTGATKGAATLTIQGGGDKLMLGVSPVGWVMFAAGVTVITGVLTGFGVIIHRRRRTELLKHTAAAY